MRRGEPILAIDRRKGRSETFVRCRVDLAFLSPRIQEAILAGTQPLDLSLHRLPLSWAEQERLFGFRPRR